MITTCKTVVSGLVALAMLLPLSASGQTQRDTGGGMLGSTSVGIMAGPHFGTFNIYGDNADFLDTSYRTGLGLGAFALFQTSFHVRIQVQAQYIQKGSIVDPDTIFLDPFEYDLAYFEVPVLVRYDVPIGASRLQPYFYGGAALAFLVSASLTINGNEDDITDDVEGFDLGLALGGGIVLGSFSNTKLFADLRYTHGLINLSNDPDAEPAENRGISLMLGVEL